MSCRMDVIVGNLGVQKHQNIVGPIRHMTSEWVHSTQLHFLPDGLSGEALCLLPHTTWTQGRRCCHYTGLWVQRPAIADLWRGYCCLGCKDLFRPTTPGENGTTCSSKGRTQHIYYMGRSLRPPPPPPLNPLDSVFPTGLLPPPCLIRIKIPRAR